MSTYVSSISVIFLTGSAERPRRPSWGLRFCRFKDPFIVGPEHHHVGPHLDKSKSLGDSGHNLGHNFLSLAPDHNDRRHRGPGKPLEESLSREQWLAENLRTTASSLHSNRCGIIHSRTAQQPLRLGGRSSERHNHCFHTTHHADRIDSVLLLVDSENNPKRAAATKTNRLACSAVFLAYILSRPCRAGQLLPYGS